jgi:two-component sensor histidine kinase
MPIGLILNEMITNSIKYAFPDDGIGCVSVELTRPDQHHILLRVSDDGVGWPAGFNPEKSTGLGTQLVVMLSEQIGAEPVWNSEKGLSLELKIPLT